MVGETWEGRAICQPMISLLPDLGANIAVGHLDWADLEGCFPHYEHTVRWTLTEYELH